MMESEDQGVSLAEQWLALGLEPPVAGAPHAATVGFVRAARRRYVAALGAGTLGSEPGFEDVERSLVNVDGYGTFQDLLDLWWPTGLVVAHVETDDEFEIHVMDLPGGRRGWDLGSRFMEQAKWYANQTGKPFIVSRVT
jgi:hypothetical protein